MKIERIELHQISQPLVHPFRTSFGLELDRPSILVAIFSEGLVGWGECTADNVPGYSYETNQTAWHILSDFLIPAVLGQDIVSPGQIPAYFRHVRGHPMAKTALENGLWDLLAKAQGIPLGQMLGGGQRDRVEVGVSIGIQPELDDLLRRVDSFVEKGYGRIKLKIEPGWELEPVSAVRHRHPDIRLMVDANSAFTLNDATLFKAMDDLKLLMIEQPLHHDDIADHAKLQAQIKTPICLDESLHTPNHVRWAIELHACRVVNMKVGRVGGFNNALAIHQMCLEADLPMWCGGMLETGIGRAANLQLSTLPNFRLPGDISATERYFAEDIAEPAFHLNTADSTITVPTGPGIGVTVMLDRIEKNRQRHQVFTA